MKKIALLIPGKYEKMFGKIVAFGCLVGSIVAPIMAPHIDREVVFTAFIFGCLGLVLYMIGQVREEFHSIGDGVPVSDMHQDILIGILRDNRELSMELIGCMDNPKRLSYKDLIGLVDGIPAEGKVIDFLNKVKETNLTQD